MIKKVTSIDDIFEDDEFGILSVKPKITNSISSDERLLASFEEVNAFIKENNREPDSGNGVQEHQLASRLKSMRENKNKSEVLLEFDKYNLLIVSKKEVNSVEDIFDDDELGIFNDEDVSLFQLKNVTDIKDRKSADLIERRKACNNFDKYEDLFIECQKDLASGKRKLAKFSSEKLLKEKRFFVLNGMLLYVEDIGDTYIDKHGKINGRQRCIFENGTESKMLFRSLVQRLYENGHIVSENIDTDEDALNKNMNAVTKDDNKTGLIYILKSRSEDPKIQSIENLFKIGFSTTPVEERLKNASRDPTYLMAPVEIVTAFECYNFNPQKLEQLLHNFFGSACLNFDIFDKKGKRYTPREWFIAPLNVIEKAIELIIVGGIINYRYDDVREEIVLR